MTDSFIKKQAVTLDRVLGRTPRTETDGDALDDGEMQHTGPSDRDKLPAPQPA